MFIANETAKLWLEDFFWIAFPENCIIYYSFNYFFICSSAVGKKQSVPLVYKIAKSFKISINIFSFFLLKSNIYTFPIYMLYLL